MIDKYTDSLYKQKPIWLLRSKTGGYYKRLQRLTLFSALITLKDVRAKNFYNTDFFHTLATVR